MDDGIASRLPARRLDETSDSGREDAEQCAKVGEETSA